ncbi:PP2C family protein-serine/threonine phosphatase, partial [Candidatus Peregrinibacteria bacterium]|nr:PP2C family protein-serine/threonine phosphatase [Candidatus Peregrinibacteria bacterium]
GLGEVSHDIKDRERILDELAIASQLQRDILPTESPQINGLYVCAKNRPATELGGDCFDFVSAKGKTYIYLGDVTGHGVAAGLIMTMVNSLIDVFANLYDSAYEILVNVNRYIKSHVKKAMFMTLVMLSWDEKRQSLSFVGAGHEHILVYRADSGTCDVILSGGIALGMVPDNSEVIREQEIPLGVGDYIVLYSDGIIEARNASGEMFGIERLTKLLQDFAPQYSAEGINYHIAKEVSAFVLGTEQQDDMTLIVIERKSADTPISVTQDNTTNWNA